MGGGPSNMQGMLRQVQKMQEEMALKREELDAAEYEVKAGGGVVTVTINRKMEIVRIDIAPEIVDPDDIETLSDIVTAAVNEAIKKVNTANADAMGQITGGMNMNIPGLF